MLTLNPSPGNSDLTPTRIAYGCWRLAGSEGGPRVAPEDGRRAVHAAIESGINFFDHADIYGRGECEQIFGDALREMPAGRESIIIATKCGICPPWDGRQHSYNSSHAHITESVENSLRRLGVDFVDILMIHRPDYLGDPEEIARAFSQLRTQGKVRWFGVSNFKPSQVTALQSALDAPLVANQVEVSLGALTCFDDGTLDQCLSAKMTPLAWSPLAKGRLAGPPQNEHDARLFSALDTIAARHGVTRAAIALAWLLKHPTKMIPIIGTLNPGRINEAIAADRIELSRDEWYELLIAARGRPIP
jgi:predicted oxidoreductase